MEIIKQVLEILIYIVPILIAVAYLTLAERKVISATQSRIGPNVVGIYGILQPFADGLKLFVKETVMPNNANIVVFLIAPMVTFILAMMGWAVIPINKGVVISDIELGILYIFGISSLSVYGVIMSGWASNSKYAFLGALRSAAQMISYEVSMGLIILSVLMCSESLNITKIVESQETIWYMIPLMPLFVMFFISTLAETNRHPFDLPEAEAELVAGYNVEYSAMGFALFFIGEYSNIILMSSMSVVLFMGGWLSPINIYILEIIPGSLWFAIKLSIIMILFILVRAAYPRYRYDQLMRLGWKVFLPISLGWVILISGIMI